MVSKSYTVTAQGGAKLLAFEVRRCGRCLGIALSSVSIGINLSSWNLKQHRSGPWFTLCPNSRATTHTWHAGFLRGIKVKGSAHLLMVCTSCTAEPQSSIWRGSNFCSLFTFCNQYCYARYCEIYHYCHYITCHYIYNYRSVSCGVIGD